MRKVVIAPTPNERCFIQSDHKVEGTVEGATEFSTFQTEPADHLKETFIDYTGQYLQDDYPTATVSFEECNLIHESANEAADWFEGSLAVKICTGLFSFLITALCVGSFIFCCQYYTMSNQ